MGVTLLILIYSIFYFVELVQLSEHNSIVEKINNIEFYGVTDEYDPNVLKELVLISETYHINVLEVERTCGNWCSKYYDSEVNSEEWVSCSEKCDIRELKKLIRSEAYGSIYRVENWWDIDSNIRYYRRKINENREEIRSYFYKFQQTVKDYEEYMKQESLAEASILEDRKKLEKIKNEAVMLGSIIDKDQIMHHCMDDAENKFDEINSFQARQFIIRCETIFYSYNM